MLFCRKHVTETNAHDSLAAQFRLSQIDEPGSIDSFDDLAVQSVDLIFLSVNKTKTNHAHADWRGQLEAVVIPYPIGKRVREVHVFAQTRSHAFVSEAAKNDPRLQRPKPPAELDT